MHSYHQMNEASFKQDPLRRGTDHSSNEDANFSPNVRLFRGSSSGA